MEKSKNISLIINCSKEDIQNIDISKFDNKYDKIYFNYNDNLNGIINTINNNTNIKYYSVWNYNNLYNGINKLDIYNINQNINISILIPVYNCESTICDCIKSCLNQDFQGTYEIIIIDDGSTDNTIKSIQSYDNDKIKLYKKKHSGISDTLNFGLTKCNGEYICRMDADDIMYKDRLSTQYQFMIEHKSIDMVCNNIDRYFKDELYITPHLEVTNKLLEYSDFWKLKYNFIVHPSICFTKDLYNKIYDKYGYFYNNKYDGAEDYELYLRLLENKINIFIDDKIILRYNVFKKPDEYNKSISHLCNKLNYQYNEELKKSHIGIYYLATDIYKNSFTTFLNSVKNFFPGIKKTIILLSDGLEEYDGTKLDNNIYIIRKYLHHQPWPIITLFKMTTILENQGDYDYVFYFNCNSIILKNNDYSWFDSNKLILAYHKDWFGNECKTFKFLEPFNDNPNSLSYMGTLDYTYVQGAFFGGKSELVYNMCKEVTEMLNVDLINNIIPRWHDESYLNKYCYLYKDTDIITIENVLISEIFYDINDLSNIEPSQFIILKENIYNKSENDKADKFSQLIPYQYLKPLYNYKNIWDYLEKYPENKYLVNNDSDVSLICIYLTNEVSDTTIKQLYELCVKIDLQKYHILLYFDNRNPYLSLLQNINNPNIHVFAYDIIHIISKLNKIEYPYKIYEYLDFMYINILYLVMYDYINNLYKPNFKYLYVFHENYINNIIKINDLNDNLYNYDTNITSDLYSINKEIKNHTIKDFIQHKYTKQLNLFKYKYKYKNHLFLNYKALIRISYNAFMFLHDIKDELKNEPALYSLPTILYNNQFIISE